MGLGANAVESGETTPFAAAAAVSQLTFRLRLMSALARLSSILLFYAVSIAFSLFNTYVLSSTGYNFGFPLFAASMYAIVQFALAAAFLAKASKCWESLAGLSNKHWLYAILPCALATGLDVGMSNSSLKFVSLSFYTMVKSSAPIFVLLCAFAFGLERPNWRLVGIIGLIAVGVLLTVWNNTAFDLFGFLLVLSASVVAGLRWALTQVIIERQDEGLKHASPLATVLVLSPLVFVLLFLLSALLEGFATIGASPFFATGRACGISIGIFVMGGTMTFLLIIAEYKVVQETSVVTLSIAGIVKELLTIGLSIWLFNDELSFLNCLGVAISIAGIGLYNYYRIRRAEDAAIYEAATGGRRSGLVPIPITDPLPAAYFPPPTEKDVEYTLASHADFEESLLSAQLAKS